MSRVSASAEAEGAVGKRQQAFSAEAQRGAGRLAAVRVRAGGAFGCFFPHRRLPVCTVGVAGFGGRRGEGLCRADSTETCPSTAQAASHGTRQAGGKYTRAAGGVGCGQHGAADAAALAEPRRSGQPSRGGGYREEPSPATPSREGRAGGGRSEPAGLPPQPQPSRAVAWLGTCHPGGRPCAGWRHWGRRQNPAEPSPPTDQCT